MSTQKKNKDTKEEREMRKSVDESTAKEKTLAVFDAKNLGEMTRMGMSRVDSADIRPPQILLIQKSSDRATFVDADGNSPQVGQFFHNGRMKILNSFECYFLFAAKSKYVDKRKTEEGEKDQYRAVGAMADDYSVFGMVFRSSALFCLSPLFTASVGLKRPMFSIKVKVETKELTGEKGTWLIPVVRILGEELDVAKLRVLLKSAQEFDEKAGSLPVDGNGNPENSDDPDIAF